MPQAFFALTDGRFVPAPHARSWWVPSMTHGRLLGGLLARTLEAEQPGPGMRFARLTVDLFRSAPLAPLEISTTRIRDGHRIRVCEATVHAGDAVYAKATAVQLRESEQPPDPAPATPAWDAPRPGTLPPHRAGATPERWHLDGRRTWVRETCELVENEPLSPFVRAALAADTASPLAHAGEQQLEFINADYSLYLSRLPEGEYVGLASGGHSSADGVAVGHCTLHDSRGPIGYCMTAAIANPGVRPNTRPQTRSGAGQ
ncbi:acyl-CoA thioesterase domain-containing protein [Amycolatopsis sp.]|uniref:acyl-CoA thioesterase domain-containing protein n=1 Tax=Amycolatopsis sp. TaxID=37632 RepID=UPI002C6A2D6D|nr:acyl-CoA thioesterase domain-containing protein [Amycolatopsis sp.]HVV07767.1 acyl-CoA thioesterase domain-containing protein [Amycolatopsis sp.]